jgi:serine/threonine protein kinase
MGPDPSRPEENTSPLPTSAAPPVEGTVVQEAEPPNKPPTEEQATAPVEVRCEPNCTQDWDAAADHKARQLSKTLSDVPPSIASYAIVRKLGEGTFGSVWLAELTEIKVRKAIKVFKARHTNRHQWQQLTDEVRTLAQLMDDPGIVHIEDADLDAEPPYFVMSYAEGGSLAQRLEEGRTLPAAEALTIFRQITEALSYVHSKGIRHCDLKPGNVLINSQGRALIADFGQAQLDSQAAPSLGTFFYMPPEQADVKNIVPDTAWDVYSLGAVFYAMVCGAPPRSDETLRTELAKTAHLHHRLRLYRETITRARPPMAHRRIRGVDRSLARIIDRCLELDPKKRYRNAGEVLKALRDRDEWHRRRPLLLVGIAATLLLLLGTYFINNEGMVNSLNQTRDALVGEQLRHDELTAQFGANVVQAEIQRRTEALMRHAGSDNNPLPTNKLVEALKTYRAQPTEEARKRITDLLEIYLHRVHKGMFSAWAVADTNGKLIAVVTDHPDKVKISNGNFRWRGWFHGGPDLRDKEGRPIAEADTKPLTAPVFIAAPFVSAMDEEPSIPMSAPILDPANKDAPIEQRTLGVLVAGVPISTLHKWLTDNTRGQAVVVLLDRLGHCLLHRPELRDQYLTRSTDHRNPPTYLGGASPYRELLAHQHAVTERNLLDPVDGETYMASFAPVGGGLNGGLLIERNSQEIDARMGELKQALLRTRLHGMIVVVALVGGLWAWLLWLLRR